MYSSVASGGTAIGLIVGGLLTSTLSWRWGMFINVPIGLTIVVFGPRILPITERHPGRFDVTGRGDVDPRHDVDRVRIRARCRGRLEQ